jgi:hypothetical protein
MAKKYFTVAEAASRKRVTRAAIHDAIRKGQLEYEWTTVEQVIKKKIRVIPAESLKAYRVDESRQARGKKPSQLDTDV